MRKTETKTQRNRLREYMPTKVKSLNLTSCAEMKVEVTMQTLFQKVEVTMQTLSQKVEVTMQTLSQKVEVTMQTLSQKVEVQCKLYFKKWRSQCKLYLKKWRSPCKLYLRKWRSQCKLYFKQPARETWNLQTPTPNVLNNLQHYLSLLTFTHYYISFLIPAYHERYWQQSVHSQHQPWMVQLLQSAPIA